MPVIVFIRDSPYGMPIVQSVHLVGITVLLAAMLVLNLRLVGLVIPECPLPWLARQLRPWALAALAVVILSGLVIFAGTPAKYLASNPFRIKMIALCLAAVFQFIVLRRFVRSEPASRPSALNLAAAALSLTLWFGVGWAGRAIAFVP
jgi:Family of unknown function (DUF6644)